MLNRLIIEFITHTDHWVSKMNKSLILLYTLHTRAHTQTHTYIKLHKTVKRLIRANKAWFTLTVGSLMESGNTSISHVIQWEGSHSELTSEVEWKSESWNREIGDRNILDTISLDLLKTSWKEWTKTVNRICAKLFNRRRVSRLIP